MNHIEGYILGLREAIQTPTVQVVEFEDFRNPNLIPPPAIDLTKFLELMEAIRHFSYLSLELPNPMSSPTMTLDVSSMLTTASDYEMSDRAAVHGRLIPGRDGDIDLAAQCGATAFHAISNGSQRASEFRQKSIREILQLTDQALAECQHSSIRKFRISLEQATETRLEDIEDFLRVIPALNDEYPHTRLAIGLPDTNGIATPAEYREILRLTAHFLAGHHIEVHTHLHNDTSQAMDNLRLFYEIICSQGIPLQIEVGINDFPGERSGIRPLIRDYPLEFFPRAIGDMLTSNQAVSDQQAAPQNICLAVAGIHSHDLSSYGRAGIKSLPHPGLYAIMGTANVNMAQTALGLPPSGRKVLKAAALLAREFAAQKGNQEHAYTLALARFCHREPDVLVEIAASFGLPHQWLRQPPPDLTNFQAKLESYL